MSELQKNSIIPQLLVNDQEITKALISKDFSLEERIEFFLEEDCRLIQTEDADFRFHSGVPAVKL